MHAHGHALRVGCVLIGVGPYTSAAVASIVFNEHVAVVDGNVIRVMSRLRALAGKPPTHDPRDPHDVTALTTQPRNPCGMADATQNNR